MNQTLLACGSKDHKVVLAGISARNTLQACGFSTADEVRTILERCGVTVRRPLSDAETQYHQKHRHMRQSRNYNLARECEEAIKEEV